MRDRGEGSEDRDREVGSAMRKGITGGKGGVAEREKRVSRVR